MKKLTSAALITATALTLSACGGTSQTPPAAAPAVSDAPTTPAPTVSVTSATTAPTPTPTETEDGRTNDRGEAVRNVGETVSYSAPDDRSTPILSFKVTSIKPVTCDSGYARVEPQKGTMIAVALQVETTKDFKGMYENASVPEVSFDSFHWKGYDKNGTRMNSVRSSLADNCLEDRTAILPSSIGPGEKANGVIILEVTSPTGEITFSPTQMMGGVTWKYPS